MALGAESRLLGYLKKPACVVRPFAAALETDGAGYVPMDALIGMAAEKFGQLPETVRDGDMYNLRVFELVRMVERKRGGCPLR